MGKNMVASGKPSNALPETLHRAIHSAIQRGLRFLDKTIGADGGWPSKYYNHLDLIGASCNETVPFVAALGILSLNTLDPRPAIEELRTRSRTFLLNCMEYPGIWRYWPSLSPDLDDTSLCSLAVSPHPWLTLGYNTRLLLACRESNGRFLTWMSDVAHSADPDSNPEIDSVVNANVLAWLGRTTPATRQAEQWIERLFQEQAETETAHSLGLCFYPDPMDLYIAVARASCLAPPVFTRLRTVVSARIMEMFNLQGRFRGPAQQAQALTALNWLDTAMPDEGTFRYSSSY